MFLRSLVNGEWEEALAGFTEWEGADAEPWNGERLREALERYHTDHERICLDPEARNIRHTYVIPSKDKPSWRVDQMLVDPEGKNDWVAAFAIDLPQSRARAEPAMRLIRIGALEGA